MSWISDNAEKVIGQFGFHLKGSQVIWYCRKIYGIRGTELQIWLYSSFCGNHYRNATKEAGYGVLFTDFSYRLPYWELGTNQDLRDVCHLRIYGASFLVFLEMKPKRGSGVSLAKRIRTVQKKGVKVEGKGVIWTLELLETVQKL